MIVRRYANSKSGDLFDITVTHPRLRINSDLFRTNRKAGEEDRLRASISRSLSAVKHIGLANDWDYFVTFTFRDGSVPDLLDSADMAKRLGRRMRHLREDNPGYDCGYLIIPELHPEKRERVHFHGLLRNLPPGSIGVNSHGYLDFFPFSDSFGFVNIQPVTNTEAVTYYCLKYVCKDIGLLSKNDKTHLYYCSRGLNRPVEIDRKNISSPDRLLLESGLHYNEEFNYFVKNGCSKEVADCILDDINDPFLNRAYSNYNENITEVVNYAKSDDQSQGYLLFGGEGRSVRQNLSLFDD